MLAVVIPGAMRGVEIMASNLGDLASTAGAAVLARRLAVQGKR